MLSKTGTTISFLLLITFCSSSWAADSPSIQAKDAAKHVGETVVVQGTVVEVHEFKGGGVVLDFDAKYPNEDFEVYVPRNLAESMNLQQYQGKTVTAEGTIILYKGKPEIKLENAGQLRR